MESGQHLQFDQIQRGIARLACLAAVILTVCPAWSAENRYPLSIRLVPGQVVSYNGRYTLQVPAGGGGKSLILATVDYGLVLRVEAVDGQGTAVSAEYDRFESYLRYAPTTRSQGPLVGRRFRFRIGPEGKVQVMPGDQMSPDWAGLQRIWTGWPATPLRIGEGWHDEGAQDMPLGGQTKVSRDYRLCEINAQAVPPVALLDYSERGSIMEMPVRLESGRAILNGGILGVGQVRFDPTAGLIVGAASISTLTGTLRPENHEKPFGQIRLEVEITLALRANMAPPPTGAG